MLITHKNHTAFHFENQILHSPNSLNLGLLNPYLRSATSVTRSFFLMYLQHEIRDQTEITSKKKSLHEKWPRIYLLMNSFKYIFFFSFQVLKEQFVCTTYTHTHTQKHEPCRVKMNATDSASLSSSHSSLIDGLRKEGRCCSLNREIESFQASGNPSIWKGRGQTPRTSKWGKVLGVKK